MTYVSVQTQIYSPQGWDLSDIYKSFDEPKFEQDLTGLQQKVAEFQHHYRGQVSQLTPEEMARCLQQLEVLSEQYSYLDTFANLVFCANTRSSEAKQFFNDTKLALTRIYNQLLFFNLELQDLDTTQFDELQASSALQQYNHYLNRIAQFRPHRLPEEAERTRNRDMLTGRFAFVQLYSVHRGEQDYEPVATPDDKQVETPAQLEALLFHSDGDVRYEAYCSLHQEMERHNGLYGFILNAICQDHRIESQMRGYPSTFHKQLLAADVPESVFRLIMDGVSDRIDLFQRYYQLKGQAIGQKIRTCDLNTPWTADDPLLKLDYKTGVQTLLNALKPFDVFYANRASDFFSKRWVDTKVRPGKASGVFSFPTFAKHSYLSLCYTEDYHSLFTLAHQVGRGLQFSRTRDRQTYFNTQPPLLLREVASIFNKLLLFDYLLKEAADDPLRKQAVLTRMLEDQFNLLFYQSTISRLELALHERAAQGSFDHSFVNEQWLEFYRQLCGDAVEVLPEHQYDWAGMSHIFTQPFSSYQYAAASIVSLACYQQYQAVGKDFIPSYFDFLAAGSSMNPVEALRQTVGVDLEDPATVNGAFYYVEGLIDQLQAML
ncbi:M3 family oligoendopeptidase [Allocoleopsis franciscana]|uniref:Oligoendopeptidase F n=1 Tax=Allocoleopsis franciscana PCC 7113 TaxID=1173027 RepID=K9WLG0_9CYAN|nr:M3 family metallopeptidase [Allocoleopsis franciscana]AFZ21245.1 oligoendopeptidase F [Allocoleopsis franciscana PCC 7113]